MNKIIHVHYSVYILLIFSLFLLNLHKFLIYLLIIFIHELFHMFACLCFRLKPKKIELTIIGGFIDIPLYLLSPLKRLIVSLAGILFNLLLIFVLKDKELIKYNYILIIFSMLPIYPLDGFNILESIVCLFNKNNKILKRLNIISILSLFMLLVISLVFKIYFLIIIFIFLLKKNIFYLKNYDLVFLKKLINN